jgi:hypothetical protein
MDRVDGHYPIFTVSGCRQGVPLKHCGFAGLITGDKRLRWSQHPVAPGGLSLPKKRPPLASHLFRHLIWRYQTTTVLRPESDIRVDKMNLIKDQVAGTHQVRRNSVVISGTF